MQIFNKMMYHVVRGARVPNREELFNVWHGEEGAFTLILKGALYPWFFISKLAEIFYIDCIMENAVNPEAAFLVSQFIAIWLFTPIFIHLYRAIPAMIILYFDWIDDVPPGTPGLGDY